jgi:hypothetical protein
LLGLGIVSILPSGEVFAQTPLHVRVDQVIEAKLGDQVAAPATDAEFLRRAYLDLTGTIPGSPEARAFLDDPSPYKRTRLIDRLLASPAYARRMQTVFDLMLMERRPDVHVPGPEWREYLRRSFAANKPYHQLVREILSADGSDATQRAAAKFYLDREGDPYSLTRDVGRLFLGVDLQCAQCHDHPLIDDYKQAHYHGLLAFFNRSYLFPNAMAKDAVLAERAEGDVTFVSVFQKKVTHSTAPRVIDGPPLPEPTFVKGREYLIPPEKDDKVRPIPLYSRRALLAPSLTSGAVPAFDRNIANRLWALLMKRGLVHPLDLHHGDNPPAYPELLDLLARELVALGYDIKAFLRELALSRAYQRSSEPTPGASPELSEPSKFAAAALKPLAPEQLAWSVMQATGLVAVARDAAERRYEAFDPKLRALWQTDDKRRALREELLESAVFEALARNVDPFVTLFGGVVGQAQDAGDPTVHQALFVTNGQAVQRWLAASGGNLTGRLAQLSDPTDVAEELYLSVLSRRPTEEERTEVRQYLVQRGNERARALQELSWALLASTEFRFNH